MPILMTRAAACGIRPTKNLMVNRYLSNQPFNLRHVDLADELEFYGAKWDKMGLHFWARAFGIPSPKEGELTGNQVTEYFRKDRGEEIARYCMDDVRATRELYRRWNQFLRFS
jgi:hypothetical protein